MGGVQENVTICPTCLGTVDLETVDCNQELAFEELLFPLEIHWGSKCPMKMNPSSDFTKS